METALWEFDRAVETLGTGLAERHYILGETFTMADILLSHTLRWADSRSFPPGEQNVAEYMHRCTGRDAFQRVVQRESSA